MRIKIKYKHPGKLRDAIILLHINTCPHVAHRVQSKLNAMRWEVFTQPAYNLDLSPCNFHIFGPLKKDLKGCMFTLGDNVQDNVV
jgi:hypothetical protein